MSEPLAIYLHDHLAGTALALGLLAAMRDKHPGESLGAFAAAMLIEVESDRSVLQSLADRKGSGSSKLKEVSAWFTEKVSRSRGKRLGDLRGFGVPRARGTWEACALGSIENSGGGGPATARCELRW